MTPLYIFHLYTYSRRIDKILVTKFVIIRPFYARAVIHLRVRSSLHLKNAVRKNIIFATDPAASVNRTRYKSRRSQHLLRQFVNKKGSEIRTIYFKNYRQLRIYCLGCNFVSSIPRARMVRMDLRWRLNFNGQAKSIAARLLRENLIIW